MSVTVTPTLAGAVAPVVVVAKVTVPVCVGFEPASAARGVTTTVCDDGQVVNESGAAAGEKPVPVLPTLMTTGEGVPIVPVHATVMFCVGPPSAKVSVAGSAVKVAAVAAAAVANVNVGEPVDALPCDPAKSLQLVNNGSRV